MLFNKREYEKCEIAKQNKTIQKKLYACSKYRISDRNKQYDFIKYYKRYERVIYYTGFHKVNDIVIDLDN